MPQATYLITGAAGFLGWNLMHRLMLQNPHVLGTWHRKKADKAVAERCLRFDLEADDPESLLAAASPDVVVHCAALSSRAACQDDPALARRINVDASRRLAKACSDRGAIMVFISTDLVFNGTAAPYKESDLVTPSSVYAESKAEAESAVLNACPQSYVLRTALMYGLTSDGTPGSFLSWNVRGPQQGKPVQLYTNQFRKPLYAADVAHVIEKLLSAQASYGVYHCAGPDRLSRHEIGQAIAQHFNLPEALMQPTVLEREANLGTIDDTSLRTEKIIEATGIRFTAFADGLSEIE